MALDGIKFVVSAGMTGVETVTAGATTISTSFSRLQSQLAQYALLLAGIYKLSSFVSDTVQAAAALDDLADSTGSTVASLSALANTARVSGVDFDAYRTMMNRLSVGLAGIGEDGGKAAKALELLGVQSKDPAAAMVELATSLDKYADGAEKAALVTAIFGKNGAAMLPFLKDLAQDGLEAATVTASIAAEAEKLGKDWERLKITAEGLATSVVGPLLSALNGAIDDIRKGTEAAGGFWAAILQFGLTNPFKDIATRQREVREEIEKTTKAFYQLAEDGAGEGTLGVVENRIKLLRAELEQLNRQQLRTIEMLTGPSTFDARDYRRLARPNAPGLGKDEAEKTKTAVVDLTKSYETLERQLLENVMAAANLGEVERLQLKLSTGELAKLSQAQKDRLVGIAMTLEAMRAEAEAAKALAREEAELAELRQELVAIAEKLTQASDAETQSLIAQLEQLRAEGEEIGLTRTQLAALTLSRLDAKIATLEMAAASREATVGMDAETAAMYVQLQVLRQIRAQTAQNQIKQSIVDQALAAEKEWRRAADSIESSLTDALLRGFESGADFAANFRDTLVNMFKTLVLRPIIQAIVAPVAGGLSALLPTGAAASPLGAGGGLGGIGDIFSLLGGGSSLLGGGTLFGSSLAGGGIFASGLGATFATSGIGEALGLTVAMGAGEGMALTALGSMLGTAIPVIGAVIAIASLAGAFSKDPSKVRGTFGIKPGTGGFEDNASLSTLFGNVGFLDSGTQQFSGEAAQVFNKVVGDTLAAFAERMSSEQIARLTTTLQGTDFGSFEGEYTTQDFLEKYGGDIMRKVISAAFGELDPALQAVFDGFHGTADEMSKFANVLLTVHDLTQNIPSELRATLISALDGTEAMSEQIIAFAQAYGTLQEAMNSDPLADALEAVANAGKSAYAQLGDMADAFEDLIAAYDGSTDASKEITQATVDYYNALVNVIAGIESLKTSIDAMFGKTIEDMTLETMTDDEKKVYYQQRIADLRLQLGSAVDPAEIDRLSRQINDYMRAAFGLLTPDEQRSLLADYSEYARQVNELAQERLQLAEAAAQARADELFTTLRDVMIAAANDFKTAGADQKVAAATAKAAADTMLQAARTPIEIVLPQTAVNA